MNSELTRQNKLSFSRKLVFGLAGILIILFITKIAAGTFLVVGSIIAVFLGFTNFGRQCPLLLSLQYHINRMKSKTNNQPERNNPAYDKRNSSETN